MKKYFIKNFGCLSNIHYMKRLESYLARNGYILSDIAECYEVIVSCCVVTKEDENNIVDFLEKYRDKRIFLTGCINEEVFKRFCHPSLVLMKEEDISKYFPPIENHSYSETDYDGEYLLDRTPSYIHEEINGYRLFSSKLREFDIELAEKVANSIVGYEFKGNNEKYYKILVSKGCIHHCSYCLVTKVKGQYLSRSKEEILRDMEIGYRKGYRRFILIGDEISSYGVDLYKRYALPELFDTIFSVYSDVKIGLRYLEPMVIDKIWSGIKKWISDEYIFYLNIPIQSGSERLLEKVNRKTDFNLLKGIMHEIRRKYSGPVLTHIMVGLPWENEKDVKETLELLDYFDNTSIHIFSPREGTLCAGLKTNLLAEKFILEIEEKRNVIRARYLRNTLLNMCKMEKLREGNEKEYRFRLKSLNQNVLQWLSALKWSSLEEQADIVFINPQVSGLVLRIRKTEKYYFQIKVKKDEFEWHEFSFEIEDADLEIWLKLAQEYGEPKSIIVKKRRCAVYNNKIKIYSDKVKHLGEFIEVEGTDDSVDDLCAKLSIDVKNAQKPYGRIMDEMDLNMADEIKSYLMSLNSLSLRE